MTPNPMTTFTIQYMESGITTYDYIDEFDRISVRRVFRRLHPKARILCVREN